MITRQLSLTPEMIYLIESLKVEGYWSLKNNSLAIQNKNLPFLRYIEKIVKGAGFNTHKRILIKLKILNKELIKENISLSSIDSKLFTFHLEKSPFDGSKKIVSSLPYQKSYRLILEIENKRYFIRLKECKHEFSVIANIQAWAYLHVAFPTKCFLVFLDEYSNRKDLHVEKFILTAPKEYVMAAFSALIDCEGSINHYGLFRKIRIRMRSPNYLRDWRMLLEKFGINARFSRNSELEYELCIEGWDDFIKLDGLGLNLYHSEKAKRFKEILRSYKRKQVSRGNALNFYLQKLDELDKPITAREFANIIGKNKRVVNHYLKLLDEKEMIKVDKSGTAYAYSIK